MIGVEIVGKFCKRSQSYQDTNHHAGNPKLKVERGVKTDSRRRNRSSKADGSRGGSIKVVHFFT